VQVASKSVRHAGISGFALRGDIIPSRSRHEVLRPGSDASGFVPTEDAALEEYREASNARNDVVR
jgi:hypothetical protein